MATYAISKYANTVPALTQDEETELFTRYNEQNCLVSVHKIVVAHIPLVMKVANKYYRYGVDKDDLLQEGIIALMKAAKKFKLSFGVRFCVFALHDVKYSISSFVMKNYNIINLVTTKADRLLFNNRTIVNNSENAAEELNVTQKQLEHFEEKLSGAKGLVSIDEETLHQLESPYKTPLEALEERDEQRQVEALKEAVSLLPERTQHIITGRYLQDPPKTLKELGIELGISLQRVKQIEDIALEDLKSSLVSV
jgi:RNA polymerase sigma-32 factor